MKKFALLLIVFASGFLTHAFFFPDVLSNGITDAKSIIIPNPSSESGGIKDDPLITRINYDGNKFDRHNITIRKTNYLYITNISETKLMDLIGTTKNLTTHRGYGYTEALKIQFNEKGQFAVADKNNPDERLVITVR